MARPAIGTGTRCFGWLSGRSCIGLYLAVHMRTRGRCAGSALLIWASIATAMLLIAISAALLIVAVMRTFWTRVTAWPPNVLELFFHCLCIRGYCLRCRLYGRCGVGRRGNCGIIGRCRNDFNGGIASILNRGDAGSGVNNCINCCGRCHGYGAAFQTEAQGFEYITEFVCRAAQDRHHIICRAESTITGCALWRHHSHVRLGAERQQRPDQISKPFQNIEAHGARAADVKPVRPVERIRCRRVCCNRR